MPGPLGGSERGIAERRDMRPAWLQHGMRGGDGRSCVGQMSGEGGYYRRPHERTVVWTVMFMVDRQGKKGFKRCLEVKIRQPSLMV